jgi:putative flippase GtrA
MAQAMLPTRPGGADLALRYAVFAGIATAANLGAQSLCKLAYDGPHALYPALATGTLVGLVVKYLLDKRWIFFDSAGGHARKFTLYAVMGVATTAIFWASEIGFDRLGASPYLGGALGLVIGYWVKYRLDRRFVFEAAP